MYLGVINWPLSDVQIEVVHLAEPLCVVLSCHKVATRFSHCWPPSFCCCRAVCFIWGHLLHQGQGSSPTPIAISVYEIKLLWIPYHHPEIVIFVSLYHGFLKPTFGSSHFCSSVAVSVVSISVSGHRHDAKHPAPRCFVGSALKHRKWLKFLSPVAIWFWIL
jgi:hypothetical protein